MRWELPPTTRFTSLKRLGPSPSSTMVSTLHLSPTRASTLLTAWHSGLWMSAGLRSGMVTPVCAGISDVRRTQKCAFLRGFSTVSICVSVTILYWKSDDTACETPSCRCQHPVHQNHQPAGLRRCGGTAHPGQSHAATD